MMLTIDAISKSYQDGDAQQDILSDLSFSIEKGVSVSIRGESGSGKSTLLHLLAALDTPDKGSIWFDNTDKQSSKINIASFS
jgi:ABC-type lipoprotein export system ATPase subunit